MELMDIDYIGILNYLSENQEVTYSDPDKNGLEKATKDKFLKMERNAKAIVEELEKITERCCKLYRLDYHDPIHWLDASNTKTRKNLSVQMKYKQYANSPISISLFVERDNDIIRYRVSLEIKNDGLDEQTMEDYHSHLDMEAKPGMVYVCGSNKWGNPFVIRDSKDIIKKDVAEGIRRKVQPSIYVEPSEHKTNQEFDFEIMEAIKNVIPYYKYVIGKQKSKLDESFSEGGLNTMYDKNMILYGPPGTGKTYNTAIYAVAICSNKSISEISDRPYQDIVMEYEKLKKSGRIVFTTFHQSYGYEEFIEGIKPVVDQIRNDVGYRVESGVFKKFCDDAKSIEFDAKETLINAQAQIWKLTIMNGDMNPIKRECFDEGNARMGFDYDSPEARAFVEDVEMGDIILSFKTRRSIDGIGVVTGDAEELSTKDLYRLSRNVKWLVSDIDEDITDINSDKLLHRMAFAKVPNMQLKDILDIVKKDSSEDPSTKVFENEKPYIFIIDEINRGNISKIFGELITLIEETKRSGMEEAASAVLPYSGELFSVPSNVYILGTMNTADRSIALMDTALRRRFQFVEMLPDANVLRKIGADKVGDLDVALMLETINDRIAFLYDREHTIGHAFFTKLAKDPSIQTLRTIFEKSVIPLLQEYFYEDYQKIQLVLGDNGKIDNSTKFILDEDVVMKNIFKGNPYDVVDLPEKKYLINKAALDNIEAYKQII